MLNEESKKQIFAQQVSFSGPLPPPAILREYKEIVKDGGERIVKMAEMHLDHRISLESRTLKEELRQNSRAQIFAFILGLCGILGAIFLAITNHDYVACTLIAATIGSLAVAFVAGKKFQAESQNQKHREDIK